MADPDTFDTERLQSALEILRAGNGHANRSHSWMLSSSFCFYFEHVINNEDLASCHNDVPPAILIYEFFEMSADPFIVL